MPTKGNMEHGRAVRITQPESSVSLRLDISGRLEKGQPPWLMSLDFLRGVSRKFYMELRGNTSNKMGKTKTKAEKQHLSKVASIGCIACNQLGFFGSPAEIHHCREGQGRGQRASNFDVIPLCPAHHRGTDHPRTASIHMDKRNFIAQFGTELELLERTRQELGIN